MADVLSFSLVVFSAIFFVVDPIAAVPIFITMTVGDSDTKRRLMARKACIIMAIVLLFFMAGGSVIFKLFSITLAAFKIAGGVLLMITALDMLSSRKSETRVSGDEIAEATGKEDIAIVPLAMPLLAGPGSIATVMVLATQVDHWWKFVPISLSILVTAVISYWMLRGASKLNKVLGTGGRAILERVMGLMLAAIAVQFIIGGVRDAFPELLAQASMRLPSLPHASPPHR